MHYSPEFKANAVKMSLESGLSYRQIAVRLGCTAESVRNWVMLHQATLEPKQRQEELEGTEQLKTLKKENMRLQMELDFLKKLRRTSVS